MNSVTVTPEGGEPITLSPFEIRRGQQRLREQLIELRQASPACLRIVDDYGGMAPLLLVEILHMGQPTRVHLDPLDILQRCGNKPGLPEHLREGVEQHGITEAWA